jgi:regulator of sigma E protease
MESILIKASQLLLSLSILVILHEFGHFIFARIFKTRVEKFYLFFNPWFSLYKVKKGETEYGIGWLPLGGYVKISGMIDESMDKEAMKLPPQPYEFRSKPTWQRLLMMVGGVLMNFIFAMIIYIGILYIWGVEYLPTSEVKYGIVVGETGEKIGLKTGDKILSVDGKYIEDFMKIVPTIVLESAKTIQIDRNGQKVDLKIDNSSLATLYKGKNAMNVMTVRYPLDMVVEGFAKESPGKDAGLKIDDKITGINDEVFRYRDEFDKTLLANKNKEIRLNIERKGENYVLDVKLTENAAIGIKLKQNLDQVFKFKTIKYGFFASIPAGVSKGFTTIGNYLKQFKLLFKPETQAYKSLGGFIMIGSIFSGFWDWQSFWNMTAFLSIILAVMNLLPIPALDGGHVMFLLFEIITGKKPGEKFLEYSQIVGMIILLTLVIYANANDIIKLFR